MSKVKTPAFHKWKFKLYRRVLNHVNYKLWFCFILTFKNTNIDNLSLEWSGFDNLHKALVDTWWILTFGKCFSGLLQRKWSLIHVWRCHWLVCTGQLERFFILLRYEARGSSEESCYLSGLLVRDRSERANRSSASSSTLPVSRRVVSCQYFIRQYEKSKGELLLKFTFSMQTKLRLYNRIVLLLNARRKYLYSYRLNINTHLFTTCKQKCKNNHLWFTW